MRRRVLKGATLSFSRGFSTFEGTLRIQSERGGRQASARRWPCVDI